MLFDLAAQDFEALDRVEEGVHLGGYARQPMRVHRTGGKTLDAQTYIAQEPFIDDTLLPFD